MADTPAEGPAPRPAIRILLAGASAAAREAAGAALHAGEPGIDLIQAADGRVALEILRRRPIDIALIDCRLPQVDGPAMMKAVAGASPRPLLVLMSEVLMPRWPAIANQLRAYELMLKPTRPEQVAALLRAWRRMSTPAPTLLVEGHPASRELMARMLAQSRFSLAVTQSDSGAHALKLARSGGFALALVDAALPDMSGIEAAFQMIDKAPELRVVVTGTNGDPALRSSLEQLGAAAFLKKPFEARDLENALHEAFGLWRPYLLNAPRAA